MSKRKMRVSIWGAVTIHLLHFIEEFSKEFTLETPGIISYNNRLKDKFPDSILLPKFPLFIVYFPIVIARLVSKMKKYDKKCDIHMIHYLADPLYIVLLIYKPKKPVVYFTYGSDYRYPLFKGLFRKALSRIDYIFTGSFYVDRELIHMYNIEKHKLDNTPRLFVNPIFFMKSHTPNEFPADFHYINNRYFLFSPRALRPFYNHHLIIEAVSKLPQTIKNKTIVIFIKQGVENQEYVRRLKYLAQKHDVNINILSGPLSPKQMRSIYKLSNITFSIPQNDGIGRSNLEAILSGSVVILNKNIPHYRLIFRDGRCCKYVDLNPDDIAKAIEYILKNPKKYKCNIEKIRIARLVNPLKIRKNISQKISSLLDGDAR